MAFSSRLLFTMKKQVKAIIVTVYSLICKETLEEKILQRASQKSTIQQLVMTSGHVQGDLLAPEDIVSLLIDDPQLEQILEEIPAQETLAQPRSTFPIARTETRYDRVPDRQFQRSRAFWSTTVNDCVRVTIFWWTALFSGGLYLTEREDAYLEREERLREKEDV
ncbi:hypothetical protein Tco_1559792 [Tanacetum coccineum]